MSEILDSYCGIRCRQEANIFTQILSFKDMWDLAVEYEEAHKDHRPNHEAIPGNLIETAFASFMLELSSSNIQGFCCVINYWLLTRNKSLEFAHPIF